MNCRPGQLCRIVHNRYTALGGIVDRFVTTVRLDGNSRFEPSWIYEGAPVRTRFGDVAECIPDSWLKPIDNPGEDEVDEMVRKVGAPEGVTA